MPRRNSNYTTRVIHSRISTNTILGCLDMLEVCNISTSGRPISQCVAIMLDSAISSLRQQGVIPDYYKNNTDFDPTYELNVRLGKEQPSLDINLGGAIKGAIQSTAKESESRLERIANTGDSLIKDEIRKHLEMLENPQAEIPGDIVNEDYNEEDEKPKEEKRKLNLSNTKRIPFHDAAGLAPENKWILLSLQENDNKTLRLAIEMVFGNLSQAEWKSEKVDNLIRDIEGKLHQYDLSDYNME